ncbi:MAG: M23 family metallopeptidase [Candidatus Binatus sp.]|uniref:M23 family metallopeptidase n=1 Tax=Candidatus Binatus sp. TaxID=2811406 RepID=UPI0027277DBD|nr:M23 family metallopeptidase [Candidatus Binatus sp.]MDO8434297.1 M23 family metallopeptidase [Candidatus Binatus sp.]
MKTLQVLAVAIAIALGCAISTFAEDTPVNDPLYMHLTTIPQPGEAAILDGAGHKHSAYEIYVTNFGTTPIKIEQIDVTAKAGGKDVKLETDAGKKLASMYMPLGGAKAEAPEVSPGQTGVFFIFPDFVPDQGIPESFETAIKMESHGEHSGSGTIHAPSIKINPAAPIVIQSPLRGKNWSAVNGPSNNSVHRRAILPINGLPKIGQRYAIDWVQLGDDNNTFSGDKDKNSSYHAWDQEIHAVADGKIVEVKDGVPENVPNSGKIAVQITYDTLAGNHIIQDLGGGHFAAYAHLRPGTLKVKVGDTVHAGDVIARLGNTGNSSEPHLHFQVCDAPSFPSSEGLPFAIDQFTRQDFTVDKSADGKQTLVVKSTHPMTREEPMEDELDIF